MNLELLKKFCVLAEEKHFSNSALRLHMSQSALSRAISQLERNLKAKLFTRDGRGLALTAKGEEFLIHAKSMVSSNEVFMKKFCENEEIVEGDLDVCAFPYLGAQWLIPRAGKFLENYPNLNLIIEVDSEHPNPYNYDVTLGVHLPDDPNLVQKELFPDYNKFYASKEYLEKHGVPEKAEDLDGHQLITYGGQNSYSLYRSRNLLMNVGRRSYSEPRKPYLSINSLSGMINAVLAGYGIAELPKFAAVHYKELVPVLPRIKGKNIPVYFIYQSNRKKSQKIQKFFEYLWSITEEERMLAKKYY